MSNFMSNQEEPERIAIRGRYFGLDPADAHAISRYELRSSPLSICLEDGMFYFGGEGMLITPPVQHET